MPFMQSYENINGIDNGLKILVDNLETNNSKLFESEYSMTHDLSQVSDALLSRN